MISTVFIQSRHNESVTKSVRVEEIQHQQGGERSESSVTCWSSHGEQQEAAEGAVVVAVVPDLSVVPQLHGEPVARLQQQGGAVGRRVAALTGRLLVGDQLDLCVVFVENGAHGEVGGTVGCEADVVDSTDRCCEHTWRRTGHKTYGR